MQLERQVDIDAEPDRVWEIMFDVERWPDWTASVTKVEPLQTGPLVVGGGAHVTQPRLGTRTWRVTAIEPGRSFTWETTGPGTRMIGTHTVAPRGDDGSTVTLRVDSSGWAVTLLGWLMLPMGRRYVEMEAAGLKRRVEEA